jgi:hypothetical protein
MGRKGGIGNAALGGETGFTLDSQAWAWQLHRAKDTFVQNDCLAGINVLSNVSRLGVQSTGATWRPTNPPATATVMVRFANGASVTTAILP